MLTFASWYERWNWRGKLMRISYTAGRKKGLKKSLYNWGVIPCLIPAWELVKAYRAGRMTQEEYAPAYLRGLGEKQDQVSEWLDSLKPDEDVTLLCHEKEGEFCHRLLVAELVHKQRPDIELNMH